MSDGKLKPKAGKKRLMDLAYFNITLFAEIVVAPCLKDL